mmetsp:Transcript_25976/g.48417  ORF Transcript_25976/g.48417 Transcript_25976/m.48417 type:complete len:103 (-) Transcript_25976:573-881(-)
MYGLWDIRKGIFYSNLSVCCTFHIWVPFLSKSISRLGIDKENSQSIVLREKFPSNLLNIFDSKGANVHVPIKKFDIDVVIPDSTYVKILQCDGSIFIPTKAW